MYICIHCGHEFDEPTNRYNKRWSDSDDSEPCCPNCGSPDIEEAEECSECGRMHAEESIINGMCADCVKKAANDVRLAYQYGAERTEMIELNGVLATALTRVQIEAILEHYLITNGDLENECFRFATDDEYDFVEFLKEREQ